jgi:DNA ligase (NAD+)
VLIRRSNEVIPEILGAVEHTDGSINVDKPKVCPDCKSEVLEIGANLFCPNRMCKPRIVGKVEHFAQKDAMDIEGLSEMTAGQLYDTLGFRNCSELYTLDADSLSKLEGFKDKKIANLLSAIEKSRKVTLERFIYALGIDGVGKVAARDLARAYVGINNLKNADVDGLVELENVGDITAKNIVRWFADEDNKNELENLLKYISFEEKNRVESGIFAGESVVLTGTLSDFKRSEAQKIIESLGGECQSAVTAKTTLVIAGESAGSKLDKAKKLGVKIIDEDEFKKMIQ